MKKHSLTLLVLLITFGAFAQKGRMKQKEKLKALKIAHITSQLELTTKEAEAFWPIYNAHEAEKYKTRQLLKKRNLPKVITEGEAKAVLKQMQEAEEEKVKSIKKYTEQLSKVISYKKILLLIQSEHSFKRKMIEEFRGRSRY